MSYRESCAKSISIKLSLVKHWIQWIRLISSIFMRANHRVKHVCWPFWLIVSQSLEHTFLACQFLRKDLAQMLQVNCIHGRKGNFWTRGSALGTEGTAVSVLEFPIILSVLGDTLNSICKLMKLVCFLKHISPNYKESVYLVHGLPFCWPLQGCSQWNRM